MSKMIKISEEAYRELELLRVGRQTFTDVIVELLKGRIIILEAMNSLEVHLKFREWQRKRYEDSQRRC